MRGKQLPIFNAPIVGLQYFPLSIIYGKENILPWFYCNYIQLEWQKGLCITFSLMESYYVGIPFIDKQILIRDTILDINVDIKEFLIASIKKGWYIQLCLDEYYIPGKSSYHKTHFIHDNMICGYDFSQKTFTLFGYTETYKLGMVYADLGEFENAFESVSKALYPSREGKFDYYNTVFLLRHNADAKFDMDIECINESLSDYLKSKNYGIRNRMIHNIDDKTYGISILNKLSFMFLKGELRNQEDIRLLHTLYEHKKVMNMRAIYLMDNKYIKVDQCLINGLSLLENKALTIRNLYIKFLINNNELLLIRISEQLLEIKELELMILSRFLSLLDG